jgi:hypothetical protein
MIQRIQSLYLFIITVLSVFLFRGSIINFAEISGSAIKLSFSGLSREVGMQSSEMIENVLPLTILIILIPAFSIITTFLFRKRVIQLILAKILLALISVFIIALTIYSYFILNKYEAELTLGFKMIMPVMQLSFSYLAYRGIKKDDDLVKSYDRLR